MLSILANRTYRHLFSAQIIALIGTGSPPLLWDCSHSSWRVKTPVSFSERPLPSR